LEIPFGELGGGDHRALTDLNLVVHFVLRGDRPQDLEGLRERGGFDGEGAEFAEQGRVAIGQFACSVDRGRCEEADFTAREDGLEQVAHAATDGPLSEQRVDVADVEERLSGRALERGEQLTQALLDLAPELRARDEEPRLELEQVELGQALRRVARR